MCHSSARSERTRAAFPMQLAANGVALSTGASTTCSLQQLVFDISIMPPTLGARKHRQQKHARVLGPDTNNPLSRPSSRPPLAQPTPEVDVHTRPLNAITTHAPPHAAATFELGMKGSSHARGSLCSCSCARGQTETPHTPAAAQPNAKHSTAPRGRTPSAAQPTAVARALVVRACVIEGLAMHASHHQASSPINQEAHNSTGQNEMRTHLDDANHTADRSRHSRRASRVRVQA